MGKAGRSRRAGLAGLTVVGCAAALAVTAPAQAQGSTAQSQPPNQTRYLSWPGRSAPQVSPAQAPGGNAASVERPSPAEPMPVRASAPASSAAQMAASGGLTPSPLLARPDLGVIAGPRPVRSVEESASSPVSQSPAMAVAAPARAPAPASGQAPAQVSAPVHAAPAGAFDAQPQAQAQNPPQPRVQADHDTARYYSVHRGNGREPDAPVIPEPFFLDHAPVDLAEPPPPPTLRNGRGLAPSIAEQGEP